MTERSTEEVFRDVTEISRLEDQNQEGMIGR